ncbi:MAG: hypothetical protein QHH04_04225 [Methanolinea sp.]|nr:hypothetical protein [Methanolinea sp.]
MHERRTLAVLLFLSLLIIPAVSVTITGRPETVSNGHPLFVTITNLPDGAQFSLLVETTYDVSPNTEFQFQMSQFEMPFSLKQGSITATLEGTSQNRLEVKKEDTIVSVSGKSTDGRFTTTKSYDITAGTYDYFRLSGTTLPSARSMTTRFQVTGVKQGPVDSEIGFVVNGLPSGTITLAALVDGAQVLYKTIPVGSGEPPLSPGQTSSPGPSVSQETVSFLSVDEAVKVSVPLGMRISIVKVPSSGAPEGMEVITGPYAIVPYETVFSPPGEILFSPGKTEAGNNTAVAFFSGDSWILLPSVVAGNHVTAPLGKGGIYALVRPIGIVKTQNIATETTMTATVTTVTASQITAAASPTPKAGIFPAAALFAIVITLMAFGIVKRK